MIIIKFWREADRGTLHMRMTGHAGTADVGQDLVCAAATMLAYTLAQAVTFLGKDGKLEKKPKIRLRAGRCEIVCTPTEEGYAQALNAFWVQQCGAMTLCSNYPEHVRLETIRPTDKEPLA